MKLNYLDICLRYSFLLIVAIPNLYIFYWIFTPITIYSFYFLANLFFSSQHFFYIFNSVEIIDACVAGSAYYLLLVLNLSVPSIKFKKRLFIIFFSWLIFFLANISRILILSYLAISDSANFVLIHKIFWYFLSVVFVVLIWFFEVKFFNIKFIPFYSDFKFLYKKSLFKK